MSLQITSLNSGSNGNCFYIGNSNEAVLVDAGISCREIEKRLLRLSLDVKKIKAIFITHEHSDHIKGVEVMSRKHRLPVYITPATMEHSGLFLEKQLSFPFSAYQPVIIGQLAVTAFPKMHDAKDPHSFIVSGNGINVGVLTDIGFVCDHVEKSFKHCDAVFLETNYDEVLLEEGHYPIYLKNRIRSDLGHLSNTQALKLFLNHRTDRLSHLFLSHLSKENNQPELVLQLFSENPGGAEIILASRDRETPVYTILPKNVVVQRPWFSESIPAQMSLF